MKYAIFDLDGTFVRGNTFHLFLLYMVFSRHHNLNFFIRIKIVFFALLRLFRVISHSVLKKNLLVLVFGRIDNNGLCYFVDEVISPRVSCVCLREICSARNKNMRIVLATAAPELYAKYIAKKFGFDNLVATLTPCYNGSFVECIRQHKADRVGVEIGHSQVCLVYSDHHDDEPLYRISEHGFLVNPSSRTIDRLQNYITSGRLTILRDDVLSE